MSGRAFSTAVYRYGFNGKENDDETNCLDYGFRIYNYCLARFLSVDPLRFSYPYLSSYQFASNTPVQAIDLDGCEAWVCTWASQGNDPTNNNVTRIGHTGIIVKNYKAVQEEIYTFTWDETLGGYAVSSEIVTIYEPTGSYTYYDLWPSDANLGGKAAIEDVDPAYNSQVFTMQNDGKTLVGDDADKALEAWLSHHDASQLDEIIGEGKSEVKENASGESPGGTEGRPSNGILRVNLTESETFKLAESYNNLKSANQKYNGISNNCTSFVANGLNSIGLGLTEESIYDLANILIGNICTEAFTPNETYNQLKSNVKVSVIKDAGKTTNESYEDAIIDR